eukprot:TRINITY_DN8366_c0_g1_i1.p1 TRINITY_DN8366_c0_g1~~TRINITY_DN8366_c0_g1_i1.p1  ORF type:complete len:1442 (+),score=443.95 TRINITY_DN8366_c0_g1_i1:60-4385(+)
MDLGWTQKVGLLEPRADTSILTAYPLPVKKQVVESVVGFFSPTRPQYAEACATLTDLAHVKWVMECCACACSLPLPQCEEMIGWVVELYRAWLFDSARRPAVVQKNLSFVRSEMVRHLSIVFESRTGHHNLPRDAAREAHMRLAVRVLEVYSQLGVSALDFPAGVGVLVDSDGKCSEGCVVAHHDGGVVVKLEHGEQCVTSPATLRRHDGEPTIDGENWLTLIKVLTGITDYTYKSPDGLKDLEPALVSVLLEVLLRSLQVDDGVWQTLCKFMPQWASLPSCASQWAAAWRALTLAVLPALQHHGSMSLQEVLGKGYRTRVAVAWESMRRIRCVSEVWMEWGHTLLVWRRFFHLVGDITAIGDARVYEDVVRAVRWTALLLSRAGWWDVGCRVASGAVAQAALKKQRAAGSVLGKLPSTVVCGEYPVPSCAVTGITDLFGSTMYGAVFQRCAGKDGGKAVAIGSLCDCFLRPHPVGGSDGGVAQSELRTFFAAVRCAVEDALNADSLIESPITKALLTNSAFIFAHDLPGVHSLIQPMLTLCSQVIQAGFSCQPAITAAVSECSGGSSGPGSPTAGDLTDAFHGMEDYDTDDELAHEAQLVRQRTLTMTGSDDVAPSSCSRPASPRVGHNIRHNSPSPLPSADTALAAARAQALTVLSAIVALPQHVIAAHCDPSARTEIRRVVLKALSTERDPVNLQNVLSLCTQWSLAELCGAASSSPASSPRHAPGSENNDDDDDSGSVVMSSRSSVANVAYIVKEVISLLEAVQSPEAAHRPADVYCACISLLQHLALPLCCESTIWPPSGHPAWRALARADPTLPGRAAGALPRFVLHLHDHVSRRAGSKTFAEGDVQRMCQFALDALHEWLGGCASEVLSDPDVTQQILHAVDAAVSMAGPDCPGLQASALLVWRDVLRVPFYPQCARDTSTACMVSSAVTEEEIVTCPSQSVRWFALDGCRVLTVVEQPIAEGAAEGVCPGGVTMVLRDCFGRHVWDARLQLRMHEEVAPKLTAPLQRSFARRHAISAAPEMPAGEPKPSLATVLEPLLRTVGLPDLSDAERGTADLLRAASVDAAECPIPPSEPPPAPERTVRRPDMSRLLLAHMQLSAPSQHRMVELRDTPALQSALAMLDQTPEREVHRITVVYAHRHEGEAELQQLGVEWYLGGDRRRSCPSLPTIDRFADFVRGLGWPVDSVMQPRAYTGGAAAQQWQRQRLPYYADARCEAVWTVGAAPLADVERQRDRPSKWEDDTPVRIVWNDTDREYSPSAAASEPAAELRRATEGVLQPRQSRQLEFVVQPLQSGMYSVRVVLPAASERWGQQPPEFWPGVWHSPVVDGAVLPGDLVSVMIRTASLRASRAFRELPAKEPRAGPRPFSYAPPLVTRSMMLHRYCSTLPNVSGAVPPADRKDERATVALWRQWRASTKCAATDVMSLLKSEQALG